jgi:hypothetical protein
MKSLTLFLALFPISLFSSAFSKTKKLDQQVIREWFDTFSEPDLKKRRAKSYKFFKDEFPRYQFEENEARELLKSFQDQQSKGSDLRSDMKDILILNSLLFDSRILKHLPWLAQVHLGKAFMSYLNQILAYLDKNPEALNLILLNSLELEEGLGFALQINLKDVLENVAAVVNNGFDGHKIQEIKKSGDFIRIALSLGLSLMKKYEDLGFPIFMNRFMEVIKKNILIPESYLYLDHGEKWTFENKKDPLWEKTLWHILGEESRKLWEIYGRFSAIKKNTLDNALEYLFLFTTYIRGDQYIPPRSDGEFFPGIELKVSIPHFIDSMRETLEFESKKEEGLRSPTIFGYFKFYVKMHHEAACFQLNLASLEKLDWLQRFWIDFFSFHLAEKPASSLQLAQFLIEEKIAPFFEAKKQLLLGKEKAVSIKNGKKRQKPKKKISPVFQKKPKKCRTSNMDPFDKGLEQTEPFLDETKEEDLKGSEPKKFPHKGKKKKKKKKKREIHATELLSPPLPENPSLEPYHPGPGVLEQFLSQREELIKKNQEEVLLKSIQKKEAMAEAHARLWARADPFVKNLMEHNEVYIVGGWVRDGLLDLESKDYDLVFVGEKENIPDVSIATPHRDHHYIIRLGDITLGIEHRDPKTFDLNQDGKKRDATVSALYMDKEKIIDPTHRGWDELMGEGPLTTCQNPEDFLAQDPKSILRLVYLKNRLGRELDHKVILAIRNQAYRLTGLPYPVFIQFFSKVLSSSFREKAYADLKNLGVLKVLFPNIEIAPTLPLGNMLDFGLVLHSLKPALRSGDQPLFDFFDRFKLNPLDQAMYLQNKNHILAY